MLLIRRFEEAAAKAYAQQKIKGFCHLYIGEESVAVGATGCLEPRDYVITTYREHGHAIARGVEPNKIMAELFGKVTGCSRGMGGSMHIFDVEKKFMGGHGIVGAHVPVATGLAFGSQYKNEKAVVLCFLGEGAVNIGEFHEGLSFAALWSLPVVFIVENNLYAMGTPLYRSQHMEDISKKADAYGIHRDRVDGADVLDVYHTIKNAVNRARSEQGPTLVETIAYRHRGHSMSDPAKYRSADELKSQKLKDPLLIAFDNLILAGFTKEQLQEADEHCRQQVQEAVDFAEDSEQPSLAMIRQNVYATPQ